MYMHRNESTQDCGLPSKYSEVTQEQDIGAKGKGENTVTDSGMYAEYGGK